MKSEQERVLGVQESFVVLCLQYLLMIIVARTHKFVWVSWQQSNKEILDEKKKFLTKEFRSCTIFFPFLFLNFVAHYRIFNISFSSPWKIHLKDPKKMI